MVEAIFSLDYGVESALERLYNSGLFSFFKFITGFGDSIVIVIIFACMALYFWKKGDVALVKRFTLFFCLNGVAVSFIKWFINRPRPFAASALGEVNGSFPSWHAAASIFIYGFIIYYISKTGLNNSRKTLISFSLFLLIILVGFSRLYLDVHYLSDVIGGYLIGAAFLVPLLRSRN